LSQVAVVSSQPTHIVLFSRQSSAPMYYLFSAPCTCLSSMCSGICQAFREACKCCDGICKGLKDCWDETFGNIYGKPMGGYVVFTWLCMLLTIAAGGFSLSSLKCDEDTSATNAQAMLLVSLALAVIHALVAWWFQRTICKEIVKKQTQEFKDQGIPEDQMDFTLDANVRGRIRSAIWEVFKYDFVFCLYFFIAPAAVGAAMFGMSVLPKCTHDDVQASNSTSSSGGLSDETAALLASWTFGLLIFYGCCTGLYFFFTMCGIACGAGKDKVKQTAKKVKTKGATVGKPAPA